MKAKALKQKTTQLGTEGVLNLVCERYGCNQKRRTVPIQNLIRFHQPKNTAQLLQLIDVHQKDKPLCKCGCVANGKVDDWAQRLYESYQKYSSKIENVPYKNLEDCKIFMNYLFIEGSIKGNKMEQKAVDTLKGCPLLKPYTIEEGTTEDDFKYAVDIVVKKGSKRLLGVQVKPATYKSFKYGDAVYMMNKDKNKAFGLPVLYLYYDKKGTFKGNKSFKEELTNIIKRLNYGK